ncbi:hypothetical protein TNCV_1327891 [Trichonephila clavipes]|nr:hypothetical protein TNCV_1327891 [Trichonephila clavipes]
MSQSPTEQSQHRDRPPPEITSPTFAEMAQRSANKKPSVSKLLPCAVCGTKFYTQKGLSDHAASCKKTEQAAGNPQRANAPRKQSPLDHYLRRHHRQLSPQHEAPPENKDKSGTDTNREVSHVKKEGARQQTANITTPSNSTRINNAICTCPAGGSPAFCEHVFAVLYAIEDYSCKEMYSTSTERLQTWHSPKPCKTLPSSSNQTFGKSQIEKKKIKINEEFKWQCLDNFNLPCTLALANRG